MTKLFPKDCDVNCKHFKTYDINIDDYVAMCDLLESECDLCDKQYSFLVCPIGEKLSKEDKKMSKKEFAIPVEWSCFGVIKVEAETIEDALNMIKNDTNTDGNPFSLPEGNYIDDSFKVIEGFSALEILELYNVKLLDEDK